MSVLMWTFYLLFVGWLVYGGYRLWTTPAGRTARVSAVVLVALTLLAVVRNMVENNLLTGRF